MEKKLGILCLSLLLCLTGGCREKEVILENEYEYLIGVSLSNVMEPWLSHTIDSMEEEHILDNRVNMIFKDAAGSQEKQLQDIDQLMECGVDLLVAAPGDSLSLQEKLEEVGKEIPVVVMGIDPGTESYTAFIEFNDYEIGRLAGSYILEEQYRPGNQIVVLTGPSGSTISARRLQGFQDAVLGRIGEEQIHYLDGEWIRDKAENRMKDYLIVSQKADIVFAFNDEMAYGAYLAQNQYRVTGACFLGVDGFTGNLGGLDLVERDILDATIRCSDIGILAYKTAVRILDGEEVEKHLVIEPELITKSYPPSVPEADLH